ncbi:muellerian-inhibiting factor isoform X2 [Lepisosteus oculatus]|uniref:muellerian-inhibiting factor isoform X2 n=1 Tax=Lepisosteus oculatus TaxID=7918 RepID=UPI00371E99CA
MIGGILLGLSLLLLPPRAEVSAPARSALPDPDRQPARPTPGGSRAVREEAVTTTDRESEVGDPLSVLPVEATEAPSVPGLGRCPGTAGCREPFLSAVRQIWGEGGRAEEERVSAQFGICPPGGATSSGLLKAVSALAALPAPRGRDADGLPALSPTKARWEELEERGRGRLTLHFTLPPPQRPLLPQTMPLLLFSPRGPPVSEGEALRVSFTAHTLHPHTQTVCVSVDTQFVALIGGQAAGHAHGHLVFQVTIETHRAGPALSLSELQGFLLGEDKERNTTQNPVLLLLPPVGQGETVAESPESLTGNNRARPEPSPAPGPAGDSDTFLFLNQLQDFLREALPSSRVSAPEPSPGGPPGTRSSALDGLRSPPRAPLGTSTSQELLRALLHSPSPALFRFPSSPAALRGHRGRLALPPALLASLRARLDGAAAEIGRREGLMARGGGERLAGLLALSALPGEGAAAAPDTGRQYRALLLAVALRTVLTFWDQQGEAERQRRSESQGDGRCRLHPLEVDLRMFRGLTFPSAISIGNCQGACRAPLLPQDGLANNHALLLVRLQEEGLPLARPPCCVPVRYEERQVVEISNHQTLVSSRPEMAAVQCGCR